MYCYVVFFHLYEIFTLQVKSFSNTDITTAFTSWILETTREYPLILASRMLVKFNIKPGKQFFFMMLDGIQVSDWTIGVSSIPIVQSVAVCSWLGHSEVFPLSIITLGVYFTVALA